MMARASKIEDEDVRLLASLAASIHADYVADDSAWEGSPFAWIRTRPSRQKGKIGEQLVAGWCAAKNLDVTRAPDSDCDRLINAVRVEIKFSMLWAGGNLVFQQFRDQDYSLAVCLGLGPFDAWCWVLPKALLHKHVLGVTPQHGGRSGQDTAWLNVNPQDVPQWLAGQGGRLRDALRVLVSEVERR